MTLLSLAVPVLLGLVALLFILLVMSHYELDRRVSALNRDLDQLHRRYAELSNDWGDLVIRMRELEADTTTQTTLTPPEKQVCVIVPNKDLRKLCAATVDLFTAIRDDLALIRRK